MDFFSDLYTSFFGDDGVVSGLANYFTDEAPVAEPPATPEGVDGPVPMTAPEAQPASTQRIVDAASKAPAPQDMMMTIKSEYDKGADSFKQWVASLSAEDKNIVGSILKNGAQAALLAAQQKEKIDADRGVEDRKREDKIRRGQVSAMGAGAVTSRPLTAGLIDRVG